MTSAILVDIKYILKYFSYSYYSYDDLWYIVQHAE
jgi:hypothetical protein